MSYNDRVRELLKKSRDIIAKHEKNDKVKKRDQNENLDHFLGENWTALSTQKQYELVTEEIEKNWHFPTLTVNNLLKHKSRLEQELGHPELSALTLLQSQALTFRHQSIAQYSSRLDKDESDEAAKENLNILSFQSSLSNHQHLRQMIQELPPDWRIVQISVDDEFSDSRFKKTPAGQAIDANLKLKIICVECGVPNSQDYITCHEIEALPTEDKMPSILKELQSILAKHTGVYKKDDSEKKDTKALKNEVEIGLASLLDTIENRWLNFHKVLLLGKSDSEEREKMIENCVSELVDKYFSKQADFVVSGKKKLLYKILDGYDTLTEDQYQYFTRFLFKGQRKPPQGFLPDARSKIKALKLLPVEKRKPTVLILDREIQGVPWEALKFLDKHPLSRVPSIHTLALLHQTHFSAQDDSVPKAGKVREDKIFYVLNPDKNLAKTEERLTETFKSKLGPGIISEQPTLDQMQKVLKEMDAYMYCGHGSNLKNMRLQDIEKMYIRSVPMLFGCNSGKLERMGRFFDPVGTVNYYLIATAPCFLGNILFQCILKISIYWISF